MIWALKRPPTDGPVPGPGQIGTAATEEDDDVFEEEEKEEEGKKKAKEEDTPKKGGWGTLKSKTTQILITAFGGEKKWTPAIGK